MEFKDSTSQLQNSSITFDYLSHVKLIQLDILVQRKHFE